ncbi:MAG: metal-dependent hydrolase [Melioribacteraceae bacterium]|nr:metal-dependent hydrolase [Melioribacteraceae bacterium]MCF8355128.1 metal-dependent hydrolase [Melioribacteraceae bacterium]MCF8392395.1 metal-dependent hydrolase [Melioribacteraceae bacterium]MCF8417916.1 metal-dependent hydrolase [Melioribacteraceae bacterium]
MFAINHAATALIIKKKFPTVKILWLLLSVQAVEFLWVIFNFIGVEKTSTETSVKYIGDIHLYHMPFSHSVLSALIIAAISYILIRYFFRIEKLALPFAIGVLSHIALDLLTHAKDIPLLFFQNDPKLGTELYPLFPYAAFLLELGYGIFCWYYFGGSKSLLTIIVLFNLANFTTFSPDIVGLEKYFAGEPILLTSVIAIQILVTLLLVGFLSEERLNKVKFILFRQS